MEYDLISTDKEKFSLHDCRTTSAKYEDGQLTLYFPNGIFFEDYSDDWPNTGNAAVEFLVDPMRGVSFYLFEECEGNVIRREYTMEQLIEKINNKEWELEFAYRYDGYQEILYMCWIWCNHEPYSYECQFFIGTKEEVVFRWNPPQQIYGQVK
ncbi:MAG: hypothetical protein PUC65_09510 [Clostridiales bacterium]|nr:hypothetical protein [Clostridiales bacterium]